MSNLFKDPTMRREYEAAVKAYRVKHRDLFINGEPRQSPNLGSSFSMFFWAGFRGVKAGMWNPKDPTFRRMVGYADYRAGQDMAKEANRGS